MAKNPSREEQLELAIEHLVLSYAYVYSKEETPQEMTLGELAFFLADLQLAYGEVVEEEKRIANPESNYKNYRKKLRSDFGVDYDMRGLGFSGIHDTKKIIIMCAFYVKRFCINFDQDALELFFKNISQDGDRPLRPLFYLVLVKYAAKFRLSFAFTYHKLNSNDKKDRNIIPYALAMRDGYMDLIGRDSDGVDKQFLMSRITDIKTFLPKAWMDYQNNLKEGRKSEFHYEEYLNTQEGGFGRKPQKYRLRLFAHSYDHFRHTYNIDHRVVASYTESPRDVDIEFESINDRLVRMIVFNYGSYCRLLAPSEEVERYKFVVQEQCEHYGD